MRTNTSGADESPNTATWVFQLFRYSLTAGVLWWAYMAYTNSGLRNGLFMLAGAVLCHLLAPLAWKIGDALRRFVMPSAYFSSGFSDSLQKRIFWLYGPQLVALAWLYGIGWFLALSATNRPQGPETAIEVKAEKKPLLVDGSSDKIPVENKAEKIEQPKNEVSPESVKPEVSNIPALKPEEHVIKVPPDSGEQPKVDTAKVLNQSYVFLREGESVLASESTAIHLNAMLRNPLNQISLMKARNGLENGVRLPSVGNRSAARSLNLDGTAILRGSGTPIQAVEKLELASKADPSDVEILNNYVYALFKAEKYDEAELTGLKLLGYAPKRVSAWINLGEIYAKTNRPEMATSSLIVAFQLATDKEAVYKYLVSCSEKPQHHLSVVARQALKLLGET